jgi:uncharacterized membrane protein YkvA (DUF1232 family)
MSTEEDFYQRLRLSMRRWAEGPGRSHRWVDYLMLAPDLFHLLWRLSRDPEVPLRHKGRLLAAIVYFISPIDLIPEAVFGPAAYADDVALAALVLSSLLEETSPELIARHWAGRRDVLEVIRAILKVARRMVGSGVWSGLRRRM